jgi:hypothetical protein
VRKIKPFKTRRRLLSKPGGTLRTWEVYEPARVGLNAGSTRRRPQARRVICRVRVLRDRTAGCLLTNQYSVVPLTRKAAAELLWTGRREGVWVRNEEWTMRKDEDQ